MKWIYTIILLNIVLCVLFFYSIVISNEFNSSILLIFLHFFTVFCFLLLQCLHSILLSLIYWACVSRFISMLFQTLIGNSLGKLHLPIHLDEDIFKTIQRHTNDVNIINEWYKFDPETNKYKLRTDYR